MDAVAGSGQGRIAGEILTTKIKLLRLNFSSYRSMGVSIETTPVPIYKPLRVHGTLCYKQFRIIKITSCP